MYLRISWREQMKNKQKQSNKTKKTSKLSKVAAKPEDETDMATAFSSADASQATQIVEEAEVAVESQQAEGVPAAAAGPGTAPKATRSDAAKANIKEALRRHQIAGRPTKQQLILVFGKAGYLLTWPKRTEKFGITPEAFQAALAKAVPAIRLGPGAQTVVEEPKEKA
jgi:hypothetical protein